MSQIDLDTKLNYREEYSKYLKNIKLFSYYIKVNT